MSDDAETQSRDRFRSFAAAVADASAYGYRSGLSKLLSIGPAQTNGTPSARPRDIAACSTHGGAVVRLRRNVQQRWSWALLARDERVLSHSERDFGSRQECAEDARRKGLL